MGSLAADTWPTERPTFWDMGLTFNLKASEIGLFQFRDHAVEFCPDNLDTRYTMCKKSA